MNKTEKILEFDKIKENWKVLALTDWARQEIEKTEPCLSELELKAIPLYEDFMAHCRERGFTVEHGEFGADMKVDSLNDGPVTILFDTERP